MNIEIIMEWIFKIAIISLALFIMYDMLNKGNE